MRWHKLTIDKLPELVEYEEDIFDDADKSTVHEYSEHMHNNGLEIYTLTPLERDDIIGCFQVLKRKDVYFMCGFSVSPKYRRKSVSNMLMIKLIALCGNAGIICKTLATNAPMRKTLKQHGWINEMDRFENGVLWSWWAYNCPKSSHVSDLLK